MSELGDVLLYLTKVAEEKKTKAETLDSGVVPKSNTSNQTSHPPIEDLSKAPGKTPLPVPPSKPQMSNLSPPPPPERLERRPGESVRSGGYGRGRGHGNQKIAVEDNDSSESNSDDDENWRKTRSRMKSANEVENEDLGLNVSFWNAYGVPTPFPSISSNASQLTQPIDNIADALESDSEEGVSLFFYYTKYS